MTRYSFAIGRDYAAKLIRVALRPIENRLLSPLSLLRLEFAIYWQFPKERVLKSEGEFACRELIVGEAIQSESDSGLASYAAALGVTGLMDKPESWVELADAERFIELQFGPSESEGGRNPFAQIANFDKRGWTIEEYRYDRTAGWVTIGVAADAVGVSESTLRRRVDVLEEEWGPKLIVRTEGGHRRIYLRMFMSVWED